MSRIKSENTRPEKKLFSELKKAGYKFMKHHSLPGKPDIVFPNDKVAVFIDGEYWHGKNFDDWKNKLNSFWYKKISENIKRDKKNSTLLKKMGWHVIHVWGREIMKNPKAALLKIGKSIKRSGSK
jgi:DNA mismatch endonuclease (patch repair protein)